MRRGACLDRSKPHVALHVEWDLPNGVDDVAVVQRLGSSTACAPVRSIPTCFNRRSTSTAPSATRSRRAAKALDHILQSIEIGRLLSSRDVSMWVADGSNYPGTQSMRKRIGWMQEVLSAAHAALAAGQRMLIEYKPFEPAFYHTDIADWGMALLLARSRRSASAGAGRYRAPLSAQNIEQIVAWLLDLDMLGGFHFNDRSMPTTT